MFVLVSRGPLAYAAFLPYVFVLKIKSHQFPSCDVISRLLSFVIFCFLLMMSTNLFSTDKHFFVMTNAISVLILFTCLHRVSCWLLVTFATFSTPVFSRTHSFLIVTFKVFQHIIRRIIISVVFNLLVSFTLIPQLLRSPLHFVTQIL